MYFPRAQLQVVANGRREGCAPGGGSLSRSGTPAEPNGGVVGLRTPNGGWLSRRPANARFYRWCTRNREQFGLTWDVAPQAGGVLVGRTLRGWCLAGDADRAHRTPD